jgi:hypothetical protein
MAHPSRRKGDRCEREIVALHQAAGISAHRVPLSGSVGGVYGGDLRIAGNLRAEVKARARGAGFTTLERWLTGSDLLFLRRDRAEPLVVLPWATYLRIASPVLGSGHFEPLNAPTNDNGKRSEALQAPTCARDGCGSLIPNGRRRGNPRRFCSARCRWLSWRAAHREGAA